MKLWRWVDVSNDVGLEPPARVGVITVHGMTTTGAWQKDISGSLFDADIRPEHVDYGYRVIPSLSGVVDSILQKEQIHRAKAIQRICVIGHSLGSLAVGTALEKNPGLEFHRVILWGSIVRQDYPWATIRNRGQVRRVLNERCDQDPWPPRARVMFKHLNAGDSGCYGFTDGAGILDDVHYDATGHSQIGKEVHCTKRWIPFLLNGDVPAG